MGRAGYDMSVDKCGVVDAYNEGVRKKKSEAENTAKMVEIAATKRIHRRLNDEQKAFEAEHGKVPKIYKPQPAMAIDHQASHYNLAVFSILSPRAEKGAETK